MASATPKRDRNEDRKKAAPSFTETSETARIVRYKEENMITSYELLRRGNRMRTCMRKDREEQCLSRYALPRQLMKSRLPTDSEVKVRVVDSSREKKFIKISFHLKQDEAKLQTIMTRLADMDLGNPVKSFKGLICAAPCSEGMNYGENYARAVVVKAAKRSARNVKVRFLDFGFVDYVEKTSLRKLPAGFLKTSARPYCGHRQLFGLRFNRTT